MKNYVSYENAKKIVSQIKSLISNHASDKSKHVTYSTDTPKSNGSASAGSSTSLSRGDHVHPLQTTISGNAGTSTKWSNARNINGMSVQGDSDRTNYGTCSTAASTAAKTAACTGFALINGAEITVKFTITNTAASPTLNINNTGAKPIYYRGAIIPTGYLAANRTYIFRYNGAQYDLVGDINTNTTNTAGATDSSSKLFLVGATSQAASPQTYTHNTAYVGTDGCLYSGSKKTSVEGHTHNYAGSSGAGGAANSAVKLANSRKIGNADFDGTTNISLEQIGAVSVDQFIQLQETVNHIAGYESVDGGYLTDTEGVRNSYDGGEL